MGFDLVSFFQGVLTQVERPEEEEDKTLLDSGSQRLHLQAVEVVESMT